MKKLLLNLLLLVFFISCSQSITELPKEDTIDFEFDQWGKPIGSRNRATTYPEWQNKSGLHIAYAIINKSDQSIKLEFKLFIYIARLSSNPSVLFPLNGAVLIATDIGLLAESTNANLDPIEIIDSFILEPGSVGYLIAFAEPIDWDVIWSVYSTVSIKVTGVLSKLVHIQLINTEGNAMTDRSRSK